MPQATEEFVHRYFDAFDRRDEPALLDLIHPDVEFTSLIQEVEGGFRGHEGVRRYLSELFGAFADWKVWAEEVQELGDRAVVKVRVRATSVAGGVPTDFTTGKRSQYTRERLPGGRTSGRRPKLWKLPGRGSSPRRL